IEGGIDVIQLRAKGFSHDDVRRWAETLLTICREAGVPFIVNDHADIAAAIGADGVHVGQDDASMDQVRAIVGPDLLVGRSTHSLGQAAAAAAVLLAAGTKGKRLALPHSRVLLHQPYGQVGYGQVTDLEIAAKEIMRMRDLLEEILARHTGQPIARIHADTDRDFVMEASEALEYGIIDDVISSRTVVDRGGPIR
ncbi:MAG: ATP-dependent Clp protease proteolytic subunit, partial [Ilumatobacteraceae bacterium]